MSNTDRLPEAVEAALAELLHAQLMLGVATAKRRLTADALEVLAASKALVAVCDAVRAATAQPAAPVVERADSATPVVERGAGNVSDNAATVAPARWYCVTNYGGATLCTGRDDAAEVAAEQDIAVPPHGPHRAVMLAEVPPARGPLYDQAALDAALNLWPRDCRLCANFTTRTGGCVSVVQCVDSMQFKATPPRQYWVSAPNVLVSGPTGADDL